MKTTATRKKFEIVNLNPPYEPQERALPRFETVPELASNCQPDAGEGHRLYLTHEAMGHIRSHVGWGEMNQHNCVEQGGLLLGQAFRDSTGGVTYGVVTAAVAGRSARGSSVHLEMTHNTWKEMLDSAERLLEQSPQSELQVIGWYHTHPNGLDVFMSGTDRQTQGRMFAHDWQFAVVLNPQRRRWRAFYGREAQECKGYVIKGEGGRPLGSEREEWGESGGVPRATDDGEGVGPEPPGAAPFAAERLLAWANSPKRLLWACLALLVLSLLLQCATVAIEAA
ncbi:MAG TPA: hypothetical protein VNZ44_02900, partial [Pyrinomonadaceae bacterium]|nr:hypothetical protein [Pyrinomonadaceae bacterium]